MCYIEDSLVVIFISSGSWVINVCNASYRIFDSWIGGTKGGDGNWSE
jgi:hypothetical protein